MHVFEIKNNKNKILGEFFVPIFVHTIYSDGCRGSVSAEFGCPNIDADRQQYKNILACIDISFGSAEHHSAGACGRYK